MLNGFLFNYRRLGESSHWEKGEWRPLEIDPDNPPSGPPVQVNKISSRHVQIEIYGDHDSEEAAEIADTEFRKQFPQVTLREQ